MSGWLSPLAAGASVQLSATAVLANGRNRSVTTEAVWQSSNSTVAVVSATGLVTALIGGETEIRAVYANQAGTLEISVERGDDPNSPMPGLVCGVERWPVKTLSDADATRAPAARSGRCQAITKKGTQCSRNAKAGSSYCWQHSP